MRKVHILYDLHKKLREKKIEHTEIFMNIKDKKEFSKKNATKVMDEDWDYLIILDACRYDAFCEYIGFEVDYIISYGSSTTEWCIHNF
ncbi:MAG: hypothetical protein ACFFAO_19130, partial [Candidatus Hermodarchaeota archaeon]